VSSKCFQLYYTCSERLFAVVLPPCPFHLFSPLTVTFHKLAVILRPQYTHIYLSSVNEHTTYLGFDKCEDRTTLSSGQHSSFVIGSTRIQISARTPINMSCSWFSQYLQPNTRIVSFIRPRPLPSTSFPIHHSIIAHPFDAV
jgi:hypothetical protein